MNEDEQRYEEFHNNMLADYPDMFPRSFGGFAVGPGWWPIVESLCSNIQHYIDWKNKHGQIVAQVTVDQIKEKFGGLRFYHSGGDDHTNGMIAMAESWAAHACEECGKPGKRSNSGWIRTLCAEHTKT